MERPARNGRVPQTKEEIEIPASRTAAFKAGKALADLGF
jgi:DNA-binding protein HU-beta